jgi:chromate reductase, NAD(P)H dehydrogenase (quinone)
MTDRRDVAVLVGSLRKGSLTRMVARELIALAPESLACEIVEIRDLPLYDADLETERPPAAWVTFRQRIARADAVLFATPEYNRSIPGGLKNAIDIGSRPPATRTLAKKPGAVVSVSPGAIGAFGANQAVRQSMVFLDIPMMQMPEAYVGKAAELFDTEGRLTNDKTREFLRAFMAAYGRWVETILAGRA